MPRNPSRASKIKPSKKISSKKISSEKISSGKISTEKGPNKMDLTAFPLEVTEMIIGKMLYMDLPSLLRTSKTVLVFSTCKSMVNPSPSSNRLNTLGNTISSLSGKEMRF